MKISELAVTVYPEAAITMLAFHVDDMEMNPDKIEAFAYGREIEFQPGMREDSGPFFLRAEGLDMDNIHLRLLAWKDGEVMTRIERTIEKIPTHVRTTKELNDKLIQAEIEIDKYRREEKILEDAVKTYSDEAERLRRDLIFLKEIASPEMIRRFEERRVEMKHAEKMLKGKSAPVAIHTHWP